MQSTLEMVFAACPESPRLADHLASVGPERITLRDKPSEEALEIAWLTVVRHQPEADRGAGPETSHDRPLQIRDVRERYSCTCGFRPQLNPAIRQVGVRVDDDPDPFMAALQGDRQGAKEILDAVRFLYEGTDDCLVVPVETMPDEEVKNGVEIVGALHEQAIGASRPWPHQRTSR
jgi:hypothetical protein